MNNDKLNEVVQMIKDRGYGNVKVKEVVKNGVTLTGFILGNSTIEPIIYFNRYCNSEMSTEDIAENIINLYLEHREPKDINFEMKNLRSQEFVLKNLTIALQKTSTADDDNVMKRPTEFEGIEQCLIILTQEYSFKFKTILLKDVGLSEEEAWDVAAKNLKNNINILPLKELSSYVVSNKFQEKGAAGILDKDILELLSIKLHTNKLIIVPVSIHEAVIPPYYEGPLDEILTRYEECIRDISETIDPIERLTEKAYFVNV